MKKTPSHQTAGDMTFDHLSDEELVLLRVKLELEMKHRGVAFSTGDVGEALVVEFFNSTPGLPNLQLAPTGTKNVDALSRDGDRYSIKTVRDGRKTGTIYPDESNRDKQLFEYLIIAQLNRVMTLKGVYEFNWNQFEKARSWDRRMSAWYVGCSAKRLAMGKKLL